MKITFLMIGLSCTLATPLLAQDTYWALKDNKVLNTLTGHVCVQRPNEWPIVMTNFPSVNPPEVARGVFDAGGHSLFTFTNLGIYEVDDQSTYATINGKTGGIAAFQINDGKCKQYCLVTTSRSIKKHSLDIIKVDASLVTNLVTDPTINPSVDMTDQNVSFVDGLTRRAVCVAPIPGGGHYIYYTSVSTVSNVNYTWITRYSVSGNGTLNPVSLILANQNMPLIGTGPGAKIKVSQDGASLAYQDDNQNLVIADASTGNIINSIPVNADIYGLEQHTNAAGERRWYICADDKISYVVEPTGAAPVTLQSFPAGLNTDLALGRNGTIYYATNGGYMNYFDPNSSSFNTVQINNSDSSVFIGSGGYYSFGNLVTGENNSTADAYDDLGNYEISGTNTISTFNNPNTDFNGGGSSVWKLRGNLTVKAGADITLKDLNIEMGPGSTIVVEQSEENVAWAAYLKLNNTAIMAHRSGCGNEQNLWEGIQVCGRGDQYPQVYLTGNNHLGRHATLEMVNKSILQDANWAVKNIGPNDDGSSTMGGGIIIAENSSFVNNRRSVAYAPFHYLDPSNPLTHFPYRSTFTDCKFEVSKYFQPAFVGFVTGSEVDGVLFKGCSFADKSGVASTTSYGILGVGMGFIVDQSPKGRSSFENLVNAIDADNSPTTYLTVDVRNTDFSKNDVGIHTNAIAFPVVANNLFLVPDFAKVPEAKSAIGVHIEGGYGYTIRDNTFSGDHTTGTVKNIGVLVTGTGSANHVVHSNVYQKLYTGNLSNDNNRGIASGLSFQCNSYANNSYDESARGSDPQVDGMSPIQGGYELAAGNTFQSSGTNIDNDPVEVGSLTYFYGSGSLEYPGSVNNSSSVSRIAASLNNSCHYSALDPAYTDPRTYGDGARPANNEEKVLLEQIATTKDFAGKMELLKNWNSPYSDLTQADLLISMGKIEEARTTFAGIPEKYKLERAEANAFGKWGQQLQELSIRQQQKHLQARDLNPEQVATLESLAESATIWVKLRAENWLHLYDGREFEHIILYPYAKSGDIASKQNNIAPVMPVRTSVYPNPVRDLMNVQYIGANNAVISVTDVSGKVMETQTLHTGAIQTIDFRGFADGLYFYQIAENGAVKEHGKIVKQ